MIQQSKKYKAIFFDWDGTAVLSRKASVDQVIPLMTRLLEQQIKLVIISGTTYNNIAQGNLHKLIDPKLLQNMYLGLGRGAYNYGFSKEGTPIILNQKLPNMEEKLTIHKICYEIHEWLLKNHQLNTDIVFSRPNYCKIDLMVDCDRQEQLFLQPDEIVQVNELFHSHHYQPGILGLINLAEKKGKEQGLILKATTDAKYLEIGQTLKSDNVDYYMDTIIKDAGIREEECCYWGDEFTYLGDGIPGSDAYMMTEKTKNGDFYDVSASQISLPEGVIYMGGSVNTFMKFLEQQSSC